MLVVYIAHPLGAGPDREKNRASAARWAAWAAGKGVAPIADWIILSWQWEETPDLRDKGLAIDCALVERCDEVWLCGPRVSTGMQIEADHARRHKIRVRDFTEEAGNPPLEMLA